MTIQTAEYEYMEGETRCSGLFAWEDTPGPKPCVIVAPAWGGRQAFENGRAEKLAELGYVGFAMDIYGEGLTGGSVEENSKLMQPYMEDRALLQRRMQAAVAAARGDERVDGDRIAAIGYCFGGLAVLDLARIGSDVRGVVSMHGLFVPPGNTAGTAISAKVLALHGWDDPMVPPDAVVELAKELTDAGADWQLHAYGHTKHAFSNPEANDHDLGTVYSPDAERRSWIAATGFLEEVLV